MINHATTEAQMTARRSFMRASLFSNKAVGPCLLDYRFCDEDDRDQNEDASYGPEDALRRVVGVRPGGRRRCGKDCSAGCV